MINEKTNDNEVKTLYNMKLYVIILYKYTFISNSHIHHEYSIFLFVFFLYHLNVLYDYAATQIR